jgi:hypothetical protein
MLQAAFLFRGLLVSYLFSIGVTFTEYPKYRRKSSAVKNPPDPLSVNPFAYHQTQAPKSSKVVERGI